VLPWPLNHEILGRLIAVRRPTVSIALHSFDAGHGERLMLYQHLSETTAQNRALRAEARQLLSQRPGRIATDT
jgi:hypothetical protein